MRLSAWIGNSHKATKLSQRQAKTTQVLSTLSEDLVIWSQWVGIRVLMKGIICPTQYQGKGWEAHPLDARAEGSAKL